MVATNSKNQIQYFSKIGVKKIPKVGNTEFKLHLGEKDQKQKEAEEHMKKHAKEMTLQTMDKLEALEKQREELLKTLQEAKDNAVQFEQPEEKPEELAELAKVPDTPEEELETLVEVAEAVVNSEVELDPKVKGTHFLFHFKTENHKVIKNMIHVYSSSWISTYSDPNVNSLQI